MGRTLGSSRNKQLGPKGPSPLSECLKCSKVPKMPKVNEIFVSLKTDLATGEYLNFRSLKSRFVGNGKAKII